MGAPGVSWDRIGCAILAGGGWQEVTESMSKTKQGINNNNNKSAFVRGLPLSLSAKDVVTQAARQGVTLSIGQVYNIRSTAKKRSEKPTVPSITRNRVRVEPLAVAGKEEAVLRQMVAEVGLSRARQILREVEDTFRVL